MQNDFKIALLWLIREHQPISVDDLFKLVKDRSVGGIPIFARQGSPRMTGYSGEHYIAELIEAGLIKTENGAPFDHASKLKPTAALGMIQDLFSISLSYLVQNPGSHYYAQPIFGDPFPEHGGQTWARVFVAMPFGEELKSVYTDHILKVAQALSVTCNRGDDFFSSNHIMREVWSAIFHADICIVDCTGRNPNVFYELGIAHTLGRKAILIAQSIDDIPFDVRHLRIITYDTTPQGMQDFEHKLTKTLQTELRLET